MRWLLIAALAATAFAAKEERRERRIDRRRVEPPAAAAAEARVQRVVEIKLADAWPIPSAVGYWGGLRVGGPGFAAAMVQDSEALRQRMVERLQEGLRELDPDEDPELAKDFNRVRRSVRNLRDAELRPLLLRIVERAANRSSEREELMLEHESGGAGPATRMVRPSWPFAPLPPVAPVPPAPPRGLPAELERLWAREDAFRAFRKDLEKALRRGDSSWSAFSTALGAAAEANFARGREEEARAEEALERAKKSSGEGSSSGKSTRKRRQDGAGIVVTAGSLLAAYAILRGVVQRG
jgi:hypothetical protein